MTGTAGFHVCAGIVLIDHGFALFRQSATCENDMLFAWAMTAFAPDICNHGLGCQGQRWRRDDRGVASDARTHVHGIHGATKAFGCAFTESLVLIVIGSHIQLVVA